MSDGLLTVILRQSSNREVIAAGVRLGSHRLPS